MKIHSHIRGRSITVSNKKGQLGLVLHTNIEFVDIDAQHFSLILKEDDVKSLIKQLKNKLKEYEEENE